MKTGKEKSYPGYQVGTSFLLVIFVTVCLVILGVLSLSGALRDKSYSDRTAEKIMLYYKAVSEAQHKLEEIDGMLARAYEPGRSYEEYLDNVEELFSGRQDIFFVRTGEPAVLCYEMPITDSQVLSVALEIPDSGAGEKHYKIVKWKETSCIVREEESTLPVLGFDED